MLHHSLAYSRLQSSQTWQERSAVDLQVDCFASLEMTVPLDLGAQNDCVATVGTLISSEAVDDGGRGDGL